MMSAQTVLGIDPGAHGAIAVLNDSGELLELVDMPSTPDAKVAAFAFGRARGVIEGCAGALGLPIVFLTPPTWKRLADIPPGAENKDLARTRAIARWPARADLFARKCDVDRAEACLIALAGLKREAGR